MVFFPSERPERGIESHEPHTGHFTIWAGSPSVAFIFRAEIAPFSLVLKWFGETLPPTHIPTENRISPKSQSSLNGHNLGRHPNFPLLFITRRYSAAIIMRSVRLNCCTVKRRRVYRVMIETPAPELSNFDPVFPVAAFRRRKAIVNAMMAR